MPSVVLEADGAYCICVETITPPLAQVWIQPIVGRFMEIDIQHCACSLCSFGLGFVFFPNCRSTGHLMNAQRQATSLMIRGRLQPICRLT